MAPGAAPAPGRPLPPLPPRGPASSAPAPTPTPKSFSQTLSSLKSSASATLRKLATEAQHVAANTSSKGASSDASSSPSSASSSSSSRRTMDRMPSRTFSLEAVGLLAQRAIPVLRLREQRGSFRVNCMDNLDRTNVVQSQLAKRVLRNQLSILAVASESSKVRSAGS